MKTTIKPPQKTQLTSKLPLLSWQSVVVRPSTPAGQFVVRRYGVHPAVADVLAALAGLGEGTSL